MRTTTKVVGLFLVLALLALSVFTGCAEKEETTSTKTVTIGMLQTALILGGSLYDGLSDYVRYFNEQGGEDGVQVKVVMHDTFLSPSQAITGFQICKDAGAVLIACPMSSDSRGAAPLANKEKLPLLCSIANEAMLYPPGYAWSIGPTCGQEIGTFLHWIAEKDWDWEAKGRPPKVIVWHFVSGSQEDYCRVGKAIAENLGITWLEPEIYPFPFPMDWTPYVMRLKEKSPDYVYGVIHELLTAHNDTGIPRLAEAKYCYMYGQTYVLAGDFGELAKGCMAMQQWANPTETDVPGVALMNQLHAQNKRSTELSYLNYYNWGFVLGVAACETIKIAVQDEGYPVTSAAIVRAFDKFDTDLMGMAGRVLFPAGSRQGNTAMRILKVNDDLKSVPLTDWMPTIPLDETLKAIGMLSD